MEESSSMLMMQSGNQDVFFEDMNRIEAMMNTRRQAMNAHQHADNVKAEMCNKIQDMKRAVPGLRQRIADLDATDPELVQYIIKLESINAGIWCAKCDSMKQFGMMQAVKPDNKLASVQAYNADVADMKRTLGNLEQDISGLRTEYEVRIRLLQQKIAEQQEKLSRIESSMSNDSNNISSLTPLTEPLTTSVSSVPSVQSQTPSVPSVQNTQATTKIDVSMVKKEDLPVAPTFDCSWDVDTVLSSDDLLN